MIYYQTLESSSNKSNNFGMNLLLKIILKSFSFFQSVERENWRKICHKSPGRRDHLKKRTNSKMRSMNYCEFVILFVVVVIVTDIKVEAEEITSRKGRTQRWSWWTIVSLLLNSLFLLLLYSWLRCKSAICRLNNDYVVCDAFDANRYRNL
jgi:hypothetical protein